jgi:E3 ubiquitin-protein ligase BAH
MKFARSFDKALKEAGEFPPTWINAAISYRQLKKCIKDVQRELLEIGLDNETLHRQLEVFQYTFDNPKHSRSSLSAQNI